jgi:Uma2 family endonuclease
MTSQQVRGNEMIQVRGSETINEDGIVTELDISHLAIEDDTPVDNFQSAQQQRLLVEPLYSSEALPRPFLADANVGLFYKLYGDPIVPDALLSLGVKRAEDYTERRNRSYFVWEFGKVPDVCIEVVSNQEGNELILDRVAQRQGKTQSKQDIYAQIGVRYYTVFDPLRQIQDADRMDGALLRVWTISPVGYEQLTPTVGIVAPGQYIWLEGVGLGLTLWEGPFEETTPQLWLRWCDHQGQVIPTGAEGQAVERQRAETEQQRAERLAEKLREMGVDPDTLG